MAKFSVDAARRIAKATRIVERSPTGGSSRGRWAGPGRLSPGLVRVSNDTGVAFSGRFYIVGLGDPLVLPTEDLEQFTSCPIFSGGEPASGGPLAIVQQPLDSGEIGTAVAVGTSLVTVNVQTNGERITRADTPTSSSYIDILQTHPAGRAKILWRESGTGNKAALVQLPEECDGVAYYGTLGGNLAVGGSASVDICDPLGSSTGYSVTAYAWLNTAATIASGTDVVIRWIGTERKWYVVWPTE